MTRRARVAGFLDRHATVLTILAMAALVLIPSKIAYDASTKASHAGSKASHAVVRLEDERRARIYDQNGIDHYFCGKSASLEKVLTLLLTASLESHHPSELTPAQLRARAVFEEVLGELSSAPKCEVLIPPPPKPKHGETKQEGAQAETKAAKNPASSEPFTEPLPPGPAAPNAPPGGHQGGSTGGGHQEPKHHQEAPGPTSGGEPSPPASGGSHQEEAPAAPPAPSTPPPAATGGEGPTTTVPPAEVPIPVPAESAKGLLPGAVESVEGATGCLGKLDVGCTLHEVVGG